MRNHVVEVLKKEEKSLEWRVKKYNWPPEIMHLNQIKQAIVDLREKEAQREMAKEGGDEN